MAKERNLQNSGERFGRWQGRDLKGLSLKRISLMPIKLAEKKHSNTSILFLKGQEMQKQLSRQQQVLKQPFRASLGYPKTTYSKKLEDGSTLVN